MKSASASYYFDLLSALTLKELKAKYKSTTLGFLWAFLNPLLQMIILSVVFSFFLRIQVENYPIFLFAGLLPWMFLNLSLTSGTATLVDNRDLLKKMVFPKEFLPLAAISANLVNFAASLVIFLLILAILGFVGPQLIFLPVAVILQLILTLGIVFLASSLNIVFRDVFYLVQAGLILWFYLTPIFYPLSFVPERFLNLYSVNPMVGIVGLYQYSVLGQSFPPIAAVVNSLVISLVILTTGFLVFEARKPNFADWV